MLSDLHAAASNGDLEHLKILLTNGGDLNGLDKQGRTVLYSALHAPNVEDVLRSIVTHPSVSLHTLNAACYPTGLTPLSVLASHGLPHAVRVLLEESMGAVAVDATNGDGTTAFTHAASRGHTEVAKILLQHGARPDFRDRESRTPVQKALGHPQILRICENVLRRHRWHLNQIAAANGSHNSLLRLAAGSLVPLSDQFTAGPAHLSLQLPVVLMNAVLTGDVPTLQGLLFPVPTPSQPLPLVNIPDENKRWSLIHYCAIARQPSIAVLDSLYFAGAESSLVTSDGRGWTLLHCLARYARVDPAHPEYSDELERFVIHAVCDLRAPIRAVDAKGETCLHIAAEHGECLELIQILLQLDIQGSHGLMEMKNDRGFTPLEVARPEFRVALGGGEVEDYRPISALTIRTVKPKSSISSMASVFTASPPTTCSAPESDMTLLVPQFLEDLISTSPNIVPESLEPTVFEESLDRCHASAGAILRYHYTRVEDASKQLDKLKKLLTKLEGLRDRVVQSAYDHLDRRNLQAVYPPNRRRHRDSEDSQKTAVSSVFDHDEQTVEDAHFESSSSTPNLKRTRSEVSIKPRPSLSQEDLPATLLPYPEPKKAPSKLKKWFKRMTKSAIGTKAPMSSPTGSVVNLALQPEPTATATVTEDPAVHNLVRSPFVLDIVWSDLSTVYLKVAQVEEYLQKTTHYVDKTQRITRRALRKRELALENLRDLEEYAEFADLFTRPPGRDSFASVIAKFPTTPNTLASHPSATSLVSLSSSPVHSPTAVADDEDAVHLRRLLLRKIDSQFALAETELDLCDAWLRTIGDVICGVKRQAYL